MNSKYFLTFTHAFTIQAEVAQLVEHQLPRRPIIKSIRAMRTIVIILFVFCTSHCHAQDKMYSWKHYSRPDVEFDLPDFFSHGFSDECNVSHYYDTISNNISVTVICMIPHGNFTLSEFNSYHGICLHFFDTVTYDRSEKDHFIISGSTKNKKILYVKCVKKNNSYFELDISCNKDYQYIFDKALPTILTSFK